MTEDSGRNAPKFRTQEPEQPAEQAREMPGFLPSGFRIGALHMFLQSSPDSLELESTSKKQINENPVYFRTSNTSLPLLGTR